MRTPYWRQSRHRPVLHSCLLFSNSHPYLSSPVLKTELPILFTFLDTVLLVIPCNKSSIRHTLSCHVIQHRHFDITHNCLRNFVQLIVLLIIISFEVHSFSLIINCFSIDFITYSIPSLNYIVLRSLFVILYKPLVTCGDELNIRFNIFVKLSMIELDCA